MSPRGRSTSPHPLHDVDVDMDVDNKVDKPHAKVVIVTNLTRNVVESHLQTIFGFYGDITKIDLPMYGKSGQNRGKAALEFADPTGAHKAASHMDGGQLDGAILKVELSDLPVVPTPVPRLALVLHLEEVDMLAVWTQRTSPTRHVPTSLAFTLTLAN
ncbi:hypothetical protein EIP91_001534 [Steccherinum ochraceum]|uniref:RRM domain-containing protein n=1 Tax=Steccherinum ochraceum TaxID=92696 RepID=A0A4R0RTT1_9APHY|nr:hypothetical protein EIP91_001534 [Steccherinum ochraceum]